MDIELIDLLRTVAGGFQTRMQHLAVQAAPGLTVFQARLINLIGRAEGISQMDIGVRTQRDKAQVARTVKELEEFGLVARSAHPSDGRAKCLALTEAGRLVHARLTERRGQLAADTLATFSDDEKRLLRSGLEKLALALRD